MYSLDTVAAAPYQDPWLQPFTERLRMLARGRRRIAYFYEEPNNSTFRYRTYNMVQALHGENDAHVEDTSAAYFFNADLDRMGEIADLADLLVICRSRYDTRLNRLVNAFHRRGKRVLFDVDDFVFDTDYVHLLVKTLDLDVYHGQVWDDWFAYLGRMGAALKLCDGGIATNAGLAAKMNRFANIPVAVVPNFMNREQLAMSQRVLEAKAGQRPGHDGLVHMGYFSGSPSHNRDFAMVAPALEELLEEDENLGVVVVGYIEAGPGLTRFGSRVKRYPFQDYVNLQRLVGSVEYNLMPLQYNTFTNSKSELKYFESGAVGTVSIASPSEVYARAIRHGENGYLAQAHRWAEVLREVLSSPQRYAEVAANAHADSLARFSWTGHRETILQALGLS